MLRSLRSLHYSARPGYTSHHSHSAQSPHIMVNIEMLFKTDAKHLLQIEKKISFHSDVFISLIFLLFFKYEVLSSKFA